MADRPSHARGQFSWLDRNLDPGDYVVAWAFGYYGPVALGGAVHLEGAMRENLDGIMAALGPRPGVSS